MKTPTLLILATIGTLIAIAALWPAAAPLEKRAPVSIAGERPLARHEVTPAPSASGKFDHSRLLRQLAAVEDPQVLALTHRALAATGAQEKGQAADALAALGSHEAIESLIRLAAVQDDPAHRAAILEGLNNLTSTDGLAALASALTATRDAEVLAAATTALARAGNAETLTALVDFYRERNEGPQQKNAVLHAIASLRSPDAQRALVKLAHSAPEPALAAAAQQSLETSP